MRKRVLAIGFALMLSVGSISACGEKPCDQEGALKVEHGVSYHCADRHNGQGLRWY